MSYSNIFYKYKNKFRWEDKQDLPMNNWGCFIYDLCQ